jgi:hypothetical protein
MPFSEKKITSGGAHCSQPQNVKKQKTVEEKRPATIAIPPPLGNNSSVKTLESSRRRHLRRFKTKKKVISLGVSRKDKIDRSRNTRKNERFSFPKKTTPLEKRKIYDTIDFLAETNSQNLREPGKGFIRRKHTRREERMESSAENSETRWPARGR